MRQLVGAQILRLYALFVLYNKLIMKILQINKYYYRKGGAETVFFNTISLLEKHGHTVIPFSLKNKKNEPSPYEDYFVDYPELSESSLPQKIKYLPSFIYNRGAARKLETLLQKEKPDVAHIHLMFNSMSVSILPVLRKYNIPVVMSVHDYRLVCPAYTFTDGNGNFCERCSNGRYYNCILHKCYKGNIFNSFMLSMDSYFRAAFFQPINYIDRFIFVSKFSMNKHIDKDKRYKDKCTYLYNFTPNVEVDVTQKGKYILFFGRISVEKGICTLLNAMELIPEIKLKVAGVGPLLDRLKLAAPSNVEFLGFKKGEELQSLIQNASYVIVPSECYENNPMSIIEAYMNGTPVIGSRLGGIPELIVENKTGYTFQSKSTENLKDVIEKACSITAEEYTRMSAAAKRFALENFSEESHYKQLMKNYQLVIDMKKG